MAGQCRQRENCESKKIRSERKKFVEGGRETYLYLRNKERFPIVKGRIELSLKKLNNKIQTRETK